MRVLLVTNFASHYRAPLFERLAQLLDIDFVFFTEGTEEYWQEHLGVTAAAIHSKTITGVEFLPKLRLNPALARELWRADYDVLIKCINGRLELPLSYTIAKLRRKPFILWASLWKHPTTPFHTLSKGVVNAIYRHSDAIICDGQHVADFLIREGIDANRIFVAELAVDNDQFGQEVPPDRVADFREEVGADGRPLIVSVARLVEQKGLDVLIEAVAGLRDLDPVLAVVGTGALEKPLLELAALRGVDLRLPGGRPPADMPDVYAAADVFVMSSVTTPLVTEVWGLAINEAMCQRKPVVATTAVGAVAGGLVVDGDTGLVVPERDAGALGGALRRILTSPELASRLGESGRRRVKRTSYDAMVVAYEGALAKVTNSDPGEWEPQPLERVQTHPPEARDTSPVRVLVAHVKYRQPGGEDSVFRTEVELLRASGVEVSSLELASEELDRVAPLERLEMVLRYHNHPYGRRLIRRPLERLKPDVVHFHNLIPLLGPGAMLEADAAGCATVQTLHNYRLSCLAGTHVLNGRPCLLCRPGHYLAGVRHRCYRSSMMQSLLAANATRAHWENFVRGGVPTIAITLNDYMKDRFVVAGGSPDRLVVKPNSVDAGASQAEPRSGVLAAGRLSPEKGIVDLMRVWPAGAPKLLVAGRGPLEPEVRALARGNIEYVGHLPREEMRRVMRSARVVVVPALSPAPDTLIAMEALAEGTPLVAFDAGPMGEIAAEIQPGFSVCLGDFAALARAAQDLDASPDWDDVGRRCLKLHEARYSNAVNISLLHEVYERALALKRG